MSRARKDSDCGILHSSSAVGGGGALGGFFFILSYIILAVTLLIVVQSTKNTIQTHLKLIEKRIKETSKEKNNV